MTRPNLTVMTKTQAQRIVFDGARATGVEVQSKGRRALVEARREIILSAGAFGSPHLLLLSGVGPRDEIAPHRIDMVHDLPGVGRNLQDHLDYVLTYRSLRDDVVGLNPRGLMALARAGLRWRRDGAGLFASPFAEAGAFLKSDPALDRPDLQIHFVVGIVDDHMRKLHFRFGYSAHVCVLRPHSRGSVGLTSPRPETAPRIDPAYLSDARDLDLLMTGARRMEALLEAPPLAPWRGRRFYPHDGSDAALERDIRARADTIYHPVGTCAMGRGDMAVTDTQGRVHGLQALRVVDASLMPRLIGGNTNAPTIMMAEKIAHHMRAT